MARPESKEFKKGELFAIAGKDTQVTIANPRALDLTTGNGSKLTKCVAQSWMHGSVPKQGVGPAVIFFCGGGSS